MQTFKKTLFLICLLFSFNEQIHARNAYRAYYPKEIRKLHKIETKEKRHTWDKNAGKDTVNWDWK